MGRLYNQQSGIATPQRRLHLGFWVLIVSWHDQYVNCAVLAALSPPDLRYVSRQIFVESLLKTRKFRLQFAISSQPLNECQSDRKSENGRWKSE